MTSEKAGVRRAEIGSAIAVGLSVLAVIVAFYQARIAEQQAHASVWPYVTIGYSIYDGSESPGFTWNIDNNGLGPAIIKSVVVSVDGTPRKSWPEVLAALGLPADLPKTTSSVHGRVLPPNLNRETTIQALHVPSIPEAKQLAAALSRLAMDICYCSVYDECWTAHFLEPRVEKIAHCDPHAATQFEH
jgi:hypothetical protein